LVAARDDPCGQAGVNVGDDDIAGTLVRAQARPASISAPAVPSKAPSTVLVMGLAGILQPPILGSNR